MNGFLQDLRYGFRTLRNSPGFAAVAVLTLALGIGANSAIFCVVNGVLLRPLPYQAPQQLVWFWESQPGLSQAPFSAADFLDYQGQNHTFEQLAAVRPLSFNLTGLGRAERIRGGVVSVNFFSLLGVQPLLGRAFLAAEGQPNAARVALLDYGFWQSHFGGDPGVVGRPIVLNEENVTIIGVLPEWFSFSQDLQLWLNPHEVVPEVFPNYKKPILTNREMHYLQIIGRLKPGVTLAQGQADMEAIAQLLQKQYSTNVGHNVRLVLLQDMVVDEARLPLILLLAVVGVVLLIACANIANLLLARAAGRQREMAIRTALGAGRLRVVRQLLTESTLLGLLGGAFGLLLAFGCVKLIVAAHPDPLPRVSDVRLDLPVLAFTLIVSLLTGLLFGLAPGWQASRMDLSEALKEGGRGGSEGVRPSRLRSLLVVAEFALSSVLLVGGGLLARSFVRLLEVKPGFRTDHMVTMWLNFNGAKYAPNGSVSQFVDRLLPRVAAMPGVEGAALSNDLPLEGQDTTTGISQVEGQPKLPPGHEILVGLHIVNHGFFRAMGIPLLRGRDFTPSDRADTAPVVIINQKAAETLWPGQDPLGKHMDLFGGLQSEVVGVVGNVLHNGLNEAASLDTYSPLAQMQWSYLCLSIRTPRNAAPLVAAVRSAVAEIDPDMPVHNVRSMDQVVADTLTSRRLTLYLVGAFALLALLLALVGIYGVMSYAVSQRTHEIGIRLAVGAQPDDIRRMVIRQGMRLVLLGLVFGGAAAFGVTRLISSLLFGVKPTDPVTYAGVALLLGGVALLACYVPARRATRVDPLVALRYE